jgi:hypothetical protein
LENAAALSRDDARYRRCPAAQAKRDTGAMDATPGVVAAAVPLDDQQRTATEPLRADHVRQAPDLIPTSRNRCAGRRPGSIRHWRNMSDLREIGGLNFGLRITKP